MAIKPLMDEEKLKKQGIFVTPGTGPAQQKYVPLERRTAALARDLGISPQVQGQIAMEQGLIQPPLQSQASPGEMQPQGIAQQSQGFTPQRANQQLQTAREGVGVNAAPMEKSLTQRVQSIDPRIRTQAQERQAWRIMTPQQRREKIGMAKLQQESRTAKEVMDNSPGWEQLADATGTSFDSYGNSEQFYTPDQIEYKRQAMREFDKEWADVLSNVDKTAFADPKAAYQLQEQLPSVKKYGDFLGSYRFNAIRKYATPQMRAQMDAEDRNQKLFKDWMVLRGAEEIDKAQEAHGGFGFTNDGTEDIATQIALNRDNDLASGQIWRQFLAETPQIYTAMDGKVGIDQAQAAKFNEAARQKATQEERGYREEQAQKTKDEALSQKEQAAQETIRIRDEANPLQRGRFKINPVSKEVEDTYEYTQGDIARLPEDERVKRSSALLEEISTWSGLLGFENETDETVAARIEAMKPNLLNPALAEQTQAGIDNLMANWNLYKSMGGAEEIKYEIEAKKRLRNKYKGVQ